MERSPRSVGVRPRTGASMGQYHTLRSFVISLVIAIAITKSPASGFTIPRPQNILDSTPDLETGESKQLEVRYDLKTSNDNNTIDHRKTGGEADSTVIAINDPENIDIKNNSNEKVNPIQLIVNDSANTQTKILEDSKLEVPSDSPKIISTGTANHSFTSFPPSTSQTTTRETERNQEVSMKSVTQTSLAIESQIPTFKEYLNGTIKKDIVENESNINDTYKSFESTTALSNQNHTGEIMENESNINDTHKSFESATTLSNQNHTGEIVENESNINYTLRSFESATNLSNQNHTGEIVENESNINDTHKSFESATALSNQNHTGDITSTEKQDTNNVTNILDNNDTNKTGNKTDSINNLKDSAYTERKDTRSTFDFESKVKNETDLADQKADETITKANSSIAKANGSPDVPTTTSSDSKTDVTNVMSEAYTAEVTTENFTTETLTTEFNAPTLPPWKKYTTIDRKRTSTEDTTAIDKDMVRAETAQTHINLEKVFTDTPIPSLEKLKNDLINAQESSARNLETTNGNETNISNVPDSETSTPKPMTDTAIETETTKLEIVSKRAGYKDNRETTTPKPEEATTSEFPPRVSVNNTEIFTPMYETEVSEVEVTDNKNDTVYESQSQLAEDAIKEELLKEETLHDNEENAKRHHDERIISPRVKYLKQGKIIDEPVTVHEIVTEDMLSVKPIGHEKKKNTILYAVNPNYKPLKKIDVQQPKQFVRDPDDNSWRNESISSLGIVFKPKNASKSFTQVLKNKTEVELGNMTDKDNKGDLPDLRVRLEKIAEVRKSKKKINKFGDTVYGDYEESSENVNPSREIATPPMSPFVDSVLKFTPPPASQSSTTEFDLTVNAISKENFDLFKNEGTSPLTTNKPKKFYNLAEYYDATDEYDADYVNQHKIDLKKFTKSLKPKDSSATQFPELLRTKPMNAGEYQPERKATLQYFPPTQKVTQKVNLNDYDTNFNRKVNLYTFNKAPPKNIQAASFGTVSPIQTEKYELVNKVTTKPAYTPLYQTDNLDKNMYLTKQPRVPELPSGFVPNDGNFNRASYVIKHYRDFINEAAKGGEDDRSGEYTYTESPLRGVTINELAKMTTPRDSNQGEEEYDYDVKFRKDILNRFVDNFNQNSERFKVDFPILYNSSVVHRETPENGRVASSTAFMKRLYEVGHPRPSNFLPNRKSCDPHCDNMTVELSPAYELHYYVPDQEEKEEIEPRPITVPYRYRL